jgi:CCR4-NOT transcription complex subunit 6
VEALPPSLFQVKNLEKLDLTSNKLKEIPNEIGKLSSLKYLYLSDN